MTDEAATERANCGAVSVLDVLGPRLERLVCSVAVCYSTRLVEQQHEEVFEPLGRDNVLGLAKGQRGKRQEAISSQFPCGATCLAVH